MEKIMQVLKNEFFTGYTLFDKIYMISMLALQIVVFCIAPDSTLGIIAGMSGVISVMLCAKGKISSYFVGFVQTISYLVLAWNNRFYGEVLENIFYIVTMIWGIFVWKKNMHQNEDGSQDVITKKFTPIQWLVATIGIIIATIAMGYWLNSIGSAQPYTDAATNVLAVFAQLLMVKRYREQWFWWLIIEFFCIKMWFVAGNWSMVAMYSGWVINCIYGWRNWTKMSANRP